MKHLIIVLILLMVAIPASAEVIREPTQILFRGTPAHGTPEQCADDDFDTWGQVSTGNISLQYSSTYTFIGCYYQSQTSGVQSVGNDSTTGITSFNYQNPVNTYQKLYFNSNASITTNALTIGTGGYLDITEIHCFDNATLTPSADFNATPTSGPASLYVMFNDTSTDVTGEATYNWSITPTAGVTGYLGTYRNHSASFAIPGTYNVTHGVLDSTGASDIETKTSYITVYNATTDYITTGFAAMDEPRWVQLSGASISLLDIENGTWKNVSSSATGYEEITTLNNHTISAYVTMAGYSDGDLLAQPAWNGGTYVINMYPEGYANVSAGNVTLYVGVWDTTGTYATRLSDVAVNIAYNQGGTQHNNYDITDINGMASFVVPNQTTIYIYAEKAGYTRGGTTTDSGTGNGGDASVRVDISLKRGTVTTVPTATTGPGGTTPPTIQTVDPYPCDADHPENCKRKQTDMANILVQYGPMLVMFFIALTIIGGVKQIGR